MLKEGEEIPFLGPSVGRGGTEGLEPQKVCVETAVEFHGLVR